ncbi:GcrA family cell cycle regulator [Parvularcula sp. IMCC14364]|uniref:GcrA family cell cycle regulator n=1 Tax=Parvularcula sp. IMCC14364 TaxID=3067902 RepID=UPI0027415AC9|nr:GcrA family cell cycle regulator [Parvularcula sp. IMCC14364]
MAWTDERVELLKKLWAEGLSASQIAGKMGGVTRNAVIGKVHRLGLSGRAAPAKPQLTRKTERPHKPTPRVFSSDDDMGIDLKPIMSEPEFLEPLVLSTGDNATMNTLNKNMCKWPIGDPSSDDFHFCGQSTGSGKSYCAYHAHMAFQPAQKRERPKRPEYAIAAPTPKRAAG